MECEYWIHNGTVNYWEQSANQRVDQAAVASDEKPSPVDIYATRNWFSRCGEKTIRGERKVGWYIVARDGGIWYADMCGEKLYPRHQVVDRYLLRGILR